MLGLGATGGTELDLEASGEEPGPRRWPRLASVVFRGSPERRIAPLSARAGPEETLSSSTPRPTSSGSSYRVAGGLAADLDGMPAACAASTVRAIAASTRGSCAARARPVAKRSTPSVLRRRSFVPMVRKAAARATRPPRRDPAGVSIIAPSAGAHADRARRARAAARRRPLGRRVSTIGSRIRSRRRRRRGEIARSCVVERCGVARAAARSRAPPSPCEERRRLVAAEVEHAHRRRRGRRAGRAPARAPRRAPPRSATRSPSRNASSVRKQPDALGAGSQRSVDLGRAGHVREHRDARGRRSSRRGCARARRRGVRARPRGAALGARGLARPRRRTSTSDPGVAVHAQRPRRPRDPSTAAEPGDHRHAERARDDRRVRGRRPPAIAIPARARARARSATRPGRVLGAPRSRPRRAARRCSARRGRRGGAAPEGAHVGRAGGERVVEQRERSACGSVATSIDRARRAFGRDAPRPAAMRPGSAAISAGLAPISASAVGRRCAARVSSSSELLRRRARARGAPPLLVRGRPLASTGSAGAARRPTATPGEAARPVERPLAHLPPAAAAGSSARRISAAEVAPGILVADAPLAQV